jgi:hypothetical protein
MVLSLTAYTHHLKNLLKYPSSAVLTITQVMPMTLPWKQGDVIFFYFLYEAFLSQPVIQEEFK